MFHVGLRGFKVNPLRALIFGAVATAVASCGTDKPAWYVGDSSSSSEDASSSWSSSSASSAGLPLVVQSDHYARFKDMTDEQLGDCAAKSPVDMRNANDGSGCDIGWTEDGEWLEYDIEMPKAGTFDLFLSVGSGQAGSSVKVIVDGSAVGTIDVPETSAGVFEEICLTDVAFNSGATTLRLEFSGNLNFDYLSVSDQEKPADVVKAIRVGSTSYNDGSITFESDETYATDGTIVGTPDNVSGTEHQDLYKTERYGNFSYEIPLDNGTYNVTLKMVEMYWDSEGRRIFDVMAEGEPVVTDLDIYYLVGHDQAFDLTASNIKVEDGSLSLDFSASVNYATISAVLIEKVSESSEVSSSSSDYSSSSEESSSSMESSSSSEESSSSLESSSSSIEYSSSSESSSSSSEESSSSVESSSSSEASSSSVAAPVDSDNDGLVDGLDQCPDTVAGADVDADGCELDSDSDGVKNSADQCPDTAAGATVDASGCEVDSDADGVVDSADQCPETPADVTVDASGCEVDSDSDGVVDSLDQCADTPADQVANEQGCSPEQLFIDTDGDSVDEANGADLCLDTPADAIVNADGCSADQLVGDEDAGAAIWDDSCASCHGDFANDGAYPVDPANLLATTEDTLASYIEAEMPLGATDSCVEQCAADVAAYFNTMQAEGDADGDGVKDSADQCADTVANATVDADGCEIDSDGDGVKDSADQCADTAAGEDVDASGCSENDLFVDTDGDGVADENDWAPNDPNESADSDNDGVGDNADAFPNDATETTDSDGDGVGDNSDAFPSDATESADSDADGVGDNADAFPNDATETADSDGDGVGDNSDVFPSDATESADSDADGVGDNADAFPNDATETADSDGDGVGDNSDVFPSDATESADSDADGVGDNADAFPNDANETADSDGDGVGDNSDAFPSDATESVDSDADGVGDNADQCPGTSAGQTANDSGCSSEQLFVDTDGDSIDESNGADLCLDTPAGARVNAAGCSADQLVGDDANGATVWADNCAMCHGNYINDGSSPIDPANLLKTSDDKLASYIEAEMPLGNVAACEEQCAADVAEFTRNLQAVPDSDGDGIFDSEDQCSDTPSSETAGADGCSVSQIDADTLYADSCASCHGDAGQGGSMPIPVFGKDADTLKNIIATGSVMPGIGADLSEAQIEALGLLMEGFPAPDADGDGVFDADDKCPNTTDTQGLLDSGCSISDGDATAGATIWATDCAACHGNYANQSGVPYPLDPNNFSKNTMDTILEYVDTKMPSGGADTCVDQCAADTTAFFLEMEPEPQLDGATVYADNCAVCHGADGSGAAPGNNVDIRSMTAADMRASTNATMQAMMSGYSDAEIDAAGAYIASLEKPQLDGAALYADNSCGGCHGDQGEGGSQSIPVHGLGAEALRNAINNGALMPAVAGSLSDAEIDAIGAFMESLPAPAIDGAAIFETSCGSCHTGNGLGTGTFGGDVSGATSAEIESAIGSVAVMGSLSNLSTDELDAIADAL